MRWLAFSAFSPLMEVGPTGNVAPWSWPSTVPGEYTSYEAGLVAAWIFYARLHDDLRAYSYAQARLAHEDGTPFVRPMVFGWPERPEYRDLWDQYLYGPDILVAPVWQDGVTARDVHVPPGTWVDAWTREAHEGPAVVTLPAPVHRIPILVRRGASVDLGDLAARWADAQARAAIVPDLGKLEAAAAFRTQSPGL
ncbi:MAG: hypothetical protein FJ087_03100 [Deltaproteobacteria bacterium]|nr:hypothetical protein [Deltaproteobacteria bacterium]